MAEQESCPRCGQSAGPLLGVDAAVISRLKDEGKESYEQLCSSCLTIIEGSVARGSILLAREKAKDQRKMMLWKSRVPLLKKARAHMEEKSFAEAAVSYEKYLRVLEVVFDVKPGELIPENFKESARTQELTVVASVLWDLVRIYDTSDRYGDRMKSTSDKLAIFVRYTPIYPDIMRKAEAFSRTCRNQPIIKNFMKSASEAKSRCYIATSAFDSPWAPEVEILRTWRDDFLMKSALGRFLTQIYYRTSPPIARFMDSLPAVKPFVRLCLRFFINRAVRH